MKGDVKSDVYTINAIPQLHKILGLPEPEHPLISVNGLIRSASFEALNAKPVVYNFYSISIKKNLKGNVKKAQTNNDQYSGVMIFY